MVAMPVKSRSEDSAISPVFGKVKYFAVVDESGNISFVENIEKSGARAIQLLLENGAKTLLMSHMGENPFQMAVRSGIEIFFVGKERITIKEAVEKLKNGEFQKATEIDKNIFIGHHGSHHHH
jgi:predicted Fe-Mo cluster-binding NifX family protein